MRLQVDFELLQDAPLFRIFYRRHAFLLPFFDRDDQQAAATTSSASVFVPLSVAGPERVKATNGTRSLGKKSRRATCREPTNFSPR